MVGEDVKYCLIHVGGLKQWLHTALIQLLFCWLDSARRIFNLCQSLHHFDLEILQKEMRKFPREL